MIIEVIWMIQSSNENFVHIVWKYIADCGYTSYTYLYGSNALKVLSVEMST